MWDQMPMETMKLRAIQHPGNAGELLGSFIRAEGNLRYDEFGSIEESGTWVRLRHDSWQRCNE